MPMPLTPAALPRFAPQPMHQTFGALQPITTPHPLAQAQDFLRRSQRQLVVFDLLHHNQSNPVPSDSSITSPLRRQLLPQLPLSGDIFIESKKDILKES
jgi:hypothetical protein